MRFRVPEQRCGTCGERLDAAGSIGNGLREPRPGDLSLCGFCGALHRYAKGQTLVPVTLDDLALSPVERDDLAGAQAQIRAYRARAIHPARPFEEQHTVRAPSAERAAELLERGIRDSIVYVVRVGVPAACSGCGQIEELRFGFCAPCLKPVLERRRRAREGA